MDGSLTGASESDVDKQQLTARVPLNGCPRGLTPNFSAAMEDCNLDAVKRPSCRIYHTPKTGRVVGLPLSKYSRAQHRTLLSAFQRRAAPRSMAFTKVTTQAAHLCESRRPGAAASRFWAAAGVSSGLVDGVKAPCPISKLPENEAPTVHVYQCLSLQSYHCNYMIAIICNCNQGDWQCFHRGAPRGSCRLNRHTQIAGTSNPH